MVTTAIGPFVIKSVKHFPRGTDSDKSDYILITAKNGGEVQLNLWGDCCSGSYFEENSVKEMRSLIGQTLRSIEHVEARLPHTKDDVNDFHTRYHALKLTTDKQELVIDWRNESNGYYDGECEIIGWPVEQAETAP